MGKILAENAAALSDVEERVNMFVYDELFDGIRLSDLINSHHINEKYLPQIQLPDNLVSCTDLVETAKYSDIIVFVMPKQFIEDFCKTLLGKIKPNAMAISVIKGFVLNEGDDNGGEVGSGSGIQLISQTIMKYLKVKYEVFAKGIVSVCFLFFWNLHILLWVLFFISKIPCAVLMGVNLASELTLNRYCEATLGCRDMKHSKLLKDLFSTPNFRVIVIDDADAVEVCGYLKVGSILFVSSLRLQKFKCTGHVYFYFVFLSHVFFFRLFCLFSI